MPTHRDLVAHGLKWDHLDPYANYERAAGLTYCQTCGAALVTREEVFDRRDFNPRTGNPQVNVYTVRACPKVLSPSVPWYRRPFRRSHDWWWEQVVKDKMTRG